jgi:phosphoribosylanthranilate isomerase
MFIKICGMTRREDIDSAIENGVDAIGFIFAKSPRQVMPEQVEKLAAGLDILQVGVFVNEDIERVRDIREQCGLDIIQLHGDESPDYCEKLGGRLFKAFRLKEAEIIARFADYPSEIKILLDAYVKGFAGGTGKQIDLTLLDLMDDFSRIILAGGVGPENAAALIERYNPFGIDVNSKIEVAPGIKDHDKIRELFSQLKNETTNYSK